VTLFDEALRNHDPAVGAHAADKFTDIPVDQIISVKEGTPIVPHAFPRIPAR
jgi:hypothetical protein